MASHTWVTLLGDSSCYSATVHAARRFTLLGDGSHCSATVHTARQWFTLLGDGSRALLGDGSRCSATVHTAQRWFTLLGDGSHCSTMVHNCSTTHDGGRTMSLTARLCSHLFGQAQDGVAQRIQDARGLAVGGTTPDTHGRPHGLRLQGWPSPQDEALRGTTLLGAARRVPQDTGKIS